MVVGLRGEGGPAQERSEVWRGGQVVVATLWTAERPRMKPSAWPRRVPGWGLAYLAPHAAAPTPATVAGPRTGPAKRLGDARSPSILHPVSCTDSGTLFYIGEPTKDQDGGQAGGRSPPRATTWELREVAAGPPVLSSTLRSIV